MVGNTDQHLSVPQQTYAPVNTRTAGTGEDSGNPDSHRPRSGSTASNISQRSHPVPSPSTPAEGGSDEIDYARSTSIRILSQPSRSSLRGSETPGRERHGGGGGYFGLRRSTAAPVVRRNRSSSEPINYGGQPVTPAATAQNTTQAQDHMPDIQEIVSGSPTDEQDQTQAVDAESSAPHSRRLRRARTNIHEQSAQAPRDAEYESQLVDFSGCSW